MIWRSVIGFIFFVCCVRSYAAEPPKYTPFGIPLGVDYSSEQVQKIIAEKGFVLDPDPSILVIDAKKPDAHKQDILSGKISCLMLSNVVTYVRSGNRNKLKIVLVFNPSNNEIAKIEVNGYLSVLSDTIDGQMKVVADVVGKITSDDFVGLVAQIGSQTIAPGKLCETIVSGGIVGKELKLTNQPFFGFDPILVVTHPRNIRETIDLKCNHHDKDDPSVGLWITRSNVERMKASQDESKKIQLKYMNELKKDVEEATKKRVSEKKNDTGL